MPKHDSTHAELTAYLQANKGKLSDDAMLEIAGANEVDANMLKTLTESNKKRDFAIDTAILRNAKTETPELDKIAKKGDPICFIHIADHKNLQKSTVEQMFQRKINLDSNVLEILSGRVNDPDILNKIVTQKNVNVETDKKLVKRDHLRPGDAILIGNRRLDNAEILTSVLKRLSDLNDPQYGADFKRLRSHLQPLLQKADQSKKLATLQKQMLEAHRKAKDAKKAKDAAEAAQKTAEAAERSLAAQLAAQQAAEAKAAQDVAAAQQAAAAQAAQQAAAAAQQQQKIQSMRDIRKGRK